MPDGDMSAYALLALTALATACGQEDPVDEAVRVQRAYRDDEITPELLRRIVDAWREGTD